MVPWMVWVGQPEVVDLNSDGTQKEPADSVNTFTAFDALPSLPCGQSTRPCVRLHGPAISSAAFITLLSSDCMALQSRNTLNSA